METLIMLGVNYDNCL